MCGKSFGQKFYVSEHMDAIHLGLKKFTCNVCGLSFARRRVYMVHKNTHDGEITKKCVCEVCGYRCHTKQLLTKHIRTHTGEKNYPCSVCQKMFSTGYAAKVHLNSVHYGIRQKSEIPCMLCDKMFSRQKQLRKHQLNQHMMIEFTDEFRVK